MRSPPPSLGKSKVVAASPQSCGSCGAGHSGCHAGHRPVLTAAGVVIYLLGEIWDIHGLRSLRAADSGDVHRDVGGMASGTVSQAAPARPSPFRASGRHTQCLTSARNKCSRRDQSRWGRSPALPSTILAALWHRRAVFADHITLNVSDVASAAPQCSAKGFERVAIT